MLGFNFSSFSQETTSHKSDWNGYFSFHTNTKLAYSTNRIYCANANAIFYLQKSDMSLHTLSKCNFLSDAGISTIACNTSGNVLIVGYDNGNIDLIKNDQTINIVDLKSKLISSKKTINSIVFLLNKAFIATSFGIVVLNIDNAQLEDTYILNSTGKFVGVNRLYADTSSNNIYVATNEGACFAQYGKQNLADFSNWTKLAPFNNSVCKSICYFDSTIYVTKSANSIDSLYQYKKSILNPFKKQYTVIKELHVFNDNVMIVAQNKIEAYDKQMLLKQDIDPTQGGLWNVNDACADENGSIWLIDYTSGLFHMDGAQFFCPNSPLNDNIFSITRFKNAVYLALGYPWSYNVSKSSKFSLENDNWENAIDWNSFDPIRFAFYPNEDSHYFTGTWGSGIVEYDKWNSAVNHFGTTTSSIIGDLVSDVKIDTANNVFVYCARSQKPFSVYTKDKKWYSWTYPDFSTVLDQRPLLIDKNNWKWVVADDRILVFDDKNTPLNAKDDDVKTITLYDNIGEKVAGSIITMAFDINNVLWIGTNSGLMYYSNTNQIFDDSKPRMSRNKITVNGVVDYLLASEVIQAIKVDVANRKWIGTNNGLFLVSSDGTEVLEHYTVDNSPLPTNAISSLEIISDKSELFVGTLNGMVSFNIGITEAKSNYSQVKIYPNPVNHTFLGLIKIDGLMENSIIKILDINGNLVFETASEGGTAFWNGKNVVGERVATGVYVVVLVNKDQSQKKVSKIFFIH